MANAVSRLRNIAGTRVLAVQAGLALTKKAWGTPGCPSHLRSTWSNTDFKMKDVMTFVDRGGQHLSMVAGIWCTQIVDRDMSQTCSCGVAPASLPKVP